MKKLLKLFVLALFVLMVNCKQKPKTQDELQEINGDTAQTVTKSIDGDKQEMSQNNEQTIEAFLKKLQTAIKNNDTNYIENNVLFPFEHRSGGELVDNYNSYKEIQENSELFNTIMNASYVAECDDEINKIKYYCITYFDDEMDITFYAIKKNNQFKLLRMETPN
ncbi:hypothetical protein BZG01_19750 [Labilibaculum manganireducens]|uniref:DUF3887 domain-containing protein n=1 Tax=Labilibaculum manganireducens TaxID=1940525 RepID=A0A2N3HSZ9_9BACT|nr:hypothetical protein [Labilibaculum manganireducens]PKQ61185.1 hypothetical protein BZG01_19750 [Labilibaculum manganireducens]